MRAFLAILIVVCLCQRASAQFVQDLDIGKNAHAFHGSVAIANGAKRAMGVGRTKVDLRLDNGRFLVVGAKEVLESR